MAERYDPNLEQDISKKLNVLIALTIKQVLQDKTFEATGKRRKGTSEIVHYLADMGLNAKDISQIVGSPITSVRTLLTPKRRK